MTSADVRRALLDRAFKLCSADRAVQLEKLAEAGESLSDEEALALAFWDAVESYADVTDGMRAPKRHICGWCVKAAGDGDVATAAAERMAIDEIRAHTMTCAHHPLVHAIAALTGEVERLRAGADRIVTIADEAFGPFPVQTVERGVFEQRREVGTLRARVAELEADLARRVEVGRPVQGTCACAYETGDSRCVAHPTCEGCGDAVARLGDVCDNCHGKGFARRASPPPVHVPGVHREDCDSTTCRGGCCGSGGAA